MTADEDRKPVALIPAYDPSNGLIPLLESLASSGRFLAIVLVNDGSQAEHRALFTRAQAIEGVILLEHAINLGKGAALKSGINHVLCHYPKAVGLVTADADGQHLPEDIFSVAAKLMEQPDALVLGVRSFTGAVPLRSRFGNTLTRWIFQTLIGYRLQDTQTGLRGIPIAFAPALLRIKTTGYDFELDMLIRAKERGVAAAQVPIETIYEAGNATSHFNPVLDSLKIYFVFVRYLFASVVTTLVSMMAFYLSFQLTGHLALSEAMLRVVGTFIQFFLNRGPVFRSNTGLFNAFVRFVGLIVLMGFAAYWLTLGFVEWLNLDVVTSRILAALVLYLPAFTMQRDLVFGQRPTHDQTDTEARE